jgi:hypothetical protein
MKKLAALASIAASLFFVSSASAETSTNYYNCGTGAYVVTIQMHWTGSHWVVDSYNLSQIWGHC